MSDLSTDQRAKLAASLIEQAPPGEVNDVINAIRSIIADDDALMAHAAPALRAYNLAQLTVVDHAKQGGSARTSLLSDAAILSGSENERYIDAAGKQSFTFDHVNMVAGDYEAYELPDEEESFRAELAKSLAAYTRNHFSTGQSSVNCSQFPLLPAEPAAPEPAETSAASTAELAAAPKEEPTLVYGAVPGEAEGVVTDVVEEQVGAGASEPAPTPAVGTETSPKEEVDQPGGLEKVDEAVQELKVEDDAAQTETAGSEEVPAAGAAGEKVREPEVLEVSEKEEVTGEKSSAETQETSVDSVTGSSPATEVAKPTQQRQENPAYTLEVVGNRYKTDAYWTGRWRTRWVVDQAARKVEGKIQVDVHYFEQGNVQLATQHDSSFAYPQEVSGQSIASQIVTTISKIETAYQMELQDVYGDLGDKAFRSLRRALPVTRQKVDWEKVGGYSLGTDISKSRA